MSDSTITHDDGTISPDALTEYRARRRARTQTHPISNAEGSDYTLRPFGLREGSFVLSFETPAAADAAFGALCTAQPLTLASTSRPDIGMTFVISDGDEPEIETLDTGRTTIRVPFREVTP